MWPFKRSVGELVSRQPAKLSHAGSNPAVTSIEKLQAEAVEYRRQITDMRLALQRKNRELDALHYVWCDGGCEYGAHRWSPQSINEETVLTAELNTKRLRAWWNNFQHRNKQGWNSPRKPKQKP